MEMNFAKIGGAQSDCASLFRSIQSNDSRMARSMRSNTQNLSDYSYTYSTLTENDNSEEFQPLLHTLVRDGPVRRTGPISEKKFSSANESANRDEEDDELTLSDVPLVPTLEHGSALRIQGNDKSVQSFCTSIQSDVLDFTDSSELTDDEMQASVLDKRTTRRVGPSEYVRLPVSSLAGAQSSFDPEFDSQDANGVLVPSVIANMVQRLRTDPTDVDVEVLKRVDWHDPKTKYQIAPLQKICVMMKKNTRVVRGADRKTLPVLHNVMETPEEQPVTEVISEVEMAQVVAEALTAFDKRVAETHLKMCRSTEEAIRTRVTDPQSPGVKTRTRERGRHERPASVVAATVHMQRPSSRVLRSSHHNLPSMRQSTTMFESEQAEQLQRPVRCHADLPPQDDPVVSKADEDVTPDEDTSTQSRKHRKSRSRAKLESSMSLVEMKRKNQNIMRSSCSRLPAPRQSMMSEQEIAVASDDSLNECEVVSAPYHARDGADHATGILADEVSLPAHENVKQSHRKQPASTEKRAGATATRDAAPAVASKSSPSGTHVGASRTHNSDARRRRKNLEVSRSCSFSNVEMEEAQAILEKDIELPQTNAAIPAAPMSAAGASSVRRRAGTAKTPNEEGKLATMKLEAAINGARGVPNQLRNERQHKPTSIVAHDAKIRASVNTNAYEKDENATVPDTITRLYRRRKVRHQKHRTCEVSISKLDDMQGDEIVETGTEKLHDEVKATFNRPGSTPPIPTQQNLAAHNRTNGATTKEHKHRTARASNVHFVSPAEEKVEIVQRTIRISELKPEAIAHRKRRKASSRPIQEISISVLPENVAGEIVEVDTNRLDER